MNKKLKKEWVKALRSGKYKQGVGALCTSVNGEDKFCCLGLLADICSPHIGEQLYWVKTYEYIIIGDKKENWKLVDASDRRVDTHDSFTADEGKLLSHKLLDKLGLDYVAQEHLAGMNDDGYSFLDISDWIEENL